MQAANPPLSWSVRAFALVVLSVLLVGILLLVAPETIMARWPWKLAPFSARFLGAIYAAEFVALGFLVVRNRWAPGRLVLAMALAFTLVVTLVSFFHLEMFNFGRRGPWGWFLIYGGSALAAAALLWRHRGFRHPGRTPGAGWRTVFVVQAILLGGYGALLLLAPHIAAAPFPWAADGFSARVYSGMFLAAGLGALLLSRSAAFEDFLVFGLTQVSVGAASLAGIYLAEASLPPDLAQGRPEPVAWVFGCAVVVAIGLTALEAARRERRGAEAGARARMGRGESR